MVETFQIAVRRACRLSGLARSTWYKQSTARDQSALRLRIRRSVDSKVGHVPRSDGGTLFLDELESLAPTRRGR